MVQHPRDYDEVRFAPLTCGQSGPELSTACGRRWSVRPQCRRSCRHARHRRCLDREGCVWTSGRLGSECGPLLVRLVKSVDVMVDELTTQHQSKGARRATARSRAEARVRAFLRRTVEGCQQFAALDHTYNLRASVKQGAVTAASPRPTWRACRVLMISWRRATSVR